MNPEIKPKRHKERPDWVAEAAAYVVENAHVRGLKLYQVAKHVNRSNQQVGRQVKAVTGKYLMEIFYEAKLELAKKLLLSGKTVQQTADESGFEETHMYDVFLKNTGMPPGVWKRAQLNPQQKDNTHEQSKQPSSHIEDAAQS